MTATRSLIPKISGSSEEIITTAAPWRISSLMMLYTSIFAPTSMPRVGSSKMMTFERLNSHLANTTFCWLPPERLRANCRCEGVLMLRRRI